jgi:dephospho-CoA kinase
MAVIGITGGIGTGKTTLRGMLARLLGAAVFDADVCAKDLLDSDPDVREGVQSSLGPDSYRADGKAERAVIRRRIFSDPAAKTALEAILHPRVRSAWRLLALDPRFKTGCLLIDIPLLFETRADEILHPVITVACSDETQLQRLADRGLDPEIATRIMASQMPQHEKIARAQFVVWNDGSLAALEAQAALLAARIRTL